MATTKATTAAKAEVKKEEVKAVVETKKTEAPKAVVKKTVAKKAEAPKAEAKKVEAPKAETKKVEAPKAAKAPAKKATTKATAKKAEAPKAETKKVEAPKAAAKAPAKKATTKATAKKTVAEVKIQVADREYTQEDLVKIANDVWVYDFGKKASELKKVQLFVKAEEFKVYYVFNDEITGDFNI